MPEQPPSSSVGQGAVAYAPVTDVVTQPEVDRVTEIRERAQAATRGPWRWAGNIDHSEPRLIAPGRDVIGHFPVERSKDSREYRQRFRDYRDHVSVEDIDDKGKRVGWRTPTREETHEHLRETYLEDAYGEPIQDERMGFVNEHLFYDEARKLVVFEVCRDATDREDPRVYRADIVGIRHPDAEFIAHARADVDTLLAEVDRLRALLAAGGAS